MIIQDKDQLMKILRRKQATDRYEWRPRPGFDFHKRADAAEVARYLESMAAENGGVVTTSMIAAESDNPKSPIYPLFERDMEAAALRWRLHEIRNMIASIIVVKTVKSDEPGNEPTELRVRSFHSIITDGRTAYAPVRLAATVPDLQRQIIERLYTEAQQWMNRARDFNVFTKIVEAISELPESVSQLLATEPGEDESEDDAYLIGDESEDDAA
jgi:hypothetical protein